MPERRGYRRYQAEGRVILKLADEVPRSIEAELIDLSFLGASVHAQEKIGEGIDVDFELSFSFWHEKMSGKGKIKTALEIKKDEPKIFRLGIDFVDVNKNALALVLARIASRMRMEEQSKKQVRGRSGA